MAIETRAPQTIHLGGHLTKVDTEEATAAITPGMLIELTATGYGLHPAAEAGPLTLALNAPEQNKTISDAYAIGDHIHAGVLHPGSSGLAWLASGENVAKGDVLESAGSGNLAALASGVPLARALEAIDATTGSTADAADGDRRIRVEAI